MSEIKKPATSDEAAAIIAQARTHGSTVSIMGNGSKQAIGHSANDEVVRLSSSAMSGIDQYNAEELVFVAKAGTPMAVIDKALAENGQQLPFEPADLSALLGVSKDQTIGGIAATNMSGPRRFVAGAARDCLLGVKFINGNGELIKNGGQVMKNVTGLDLVKLLGGSWGTLGMMTEVSFKVLPVSPTSKTLCIVGPDAALASQIMAAAMATSCEVSGAAHLPALAVEALGDTAPVDGDITVLRLEGLEGSVADRMDRLIAALAGLACMAEAKTTVIEDQVSRKLWGAIRDVHPFAADQLKPVWRISVAPTAGHQVAAAIQSKTGAQAFFDWQGGLVWMAMDDPEESAAMLVRGAIANHGGGHATLVRASDAIRNTVPVFQPEAPAIQALNARIRAAIDPNGVFDAARMTGPMHANAA